MAIFTRKFGILLSAALLLGILFPAAAGAEGSTAGIAALTIDTHNRYDDMDKAWDQGYLPAVSASAAKVVLPLVLDPQSGVTAVAQDTLSVQTDYGDPSGSPFVFSNLEVKVQLADHAINGTAQTKRAWLLSLNLPLEEHRVNGRYPLTFHVSYSLPDGTAATQDFTVYVTIRNGIDPNATPTPAPTPRPTAPPPPQPRLILSHYSVVPEVVEAGKEFQLNFDIHNTSENANVRNIKLTIKGEGDDLNPLSGSNTLYISKLAKAETETMTFRMKARLDAAPKTQKVTITMEYEDAKGTAYSASDEIPVPVTQPMRMEFDVPSIPASVTAGDTVPVNLNVFNMGRSSVRNVLCKVHSPGLLPEGSAFLGNMESGASKTAEFFVFIGTRDMTPGENGEVVRNSSTQELYGATEGTIDVSWEDEFGNPHTQQIKLSTQIQQPVAAAATAPTVQENPNAGQWWISIVVATATLAVLAASIVLLQRRRRKEVRGNDEAD